MLKKTTSNSSKLAFDVDLQKKSMDAVPRWALAICAVLLVISFSIRQIGLDITTPANRIMSAYATRIELEARSPNLINDSEEVKNIKSDVEKLTVRVVKLERWSHKSGKKITE